MKLSLIKGQITKAENSGNKENLEKYTKLLNEHPENQVNQEAPQAPAVAATAVKKGEIAAADVIAKFNEIQSTKYPLFTNILVSEKPVLVHEFQKQYREKTLPIADVKIIYETRQRVEKTVTF